MTEPNRLRSAAEDTGPGAMQRDRPIAGLPLLAGAGLVVAGVALSVAGRAWSELGLGLAILGGGIALLGPLLQSVRELRESRLNPAWQVIPPWLRLPMRLRPVAYAIGPVLLIAAGLVFVATALLGR